jgi:hypothetical protein
MGGSFAEKNAVFEFLHFGETSSAASEVSPGGRNYGGRNPPSFAGSTVGGPMTGHPRSSGAFLLHCIQAARSIRQVIRSILARSRIARRAQVALSAELANGVGPTAGGC